MNAFFNALSVLGFFLSIAAAFSAARSVTAARELRDRLNPLPLSRLQSLETSLADTQDALSEVANRVKMMRVRSSANHVREAKEPNALPDPYKDPDGWRNAMNSRLSRVKVGLPT
jgi:hypothetical protein